MKYFVKSLPDAAWLISAVHLFIGKVDIAIYFCVFAIYLQNEVKE